MTDVLPLKMTIFPHPAHEHPVWTWGQFLEGILEDCWLLQTPFHKPEDLYEAITDLWLQGTFQLLDPEVTEFCTFLLSFLLFSPPPPDPLLIPLD